MQKSFISSKPENWEPPFPSIGEVIRSAVNVLETKRNAPRDFDRLARGELFDYDVIGRKWEDAFNIQKELQFGKIKEALNRMKENLLNEYIRTLLADISCGYPRKKVIDCLVKKITYIIYSSIEGIIGEMGGLLHDFIVSDKPVALAFEWKYKEEWKKFREPSRVAATKITKKENDNIYRWISGEQVPDMDDLFSVVGKFCKYLNAEVDGIYRVFFCAKIIHNLKNYLQVSSELRNLSDSRIITPNFYEPFKKTLFDSYKDNPLLEETLNCAKEYLTVYNKIEKKICKEVHSIDNKEDLSKQLKELEKMTHNLQDIRICWWRTQRLRAYWYVLSGEWKSAVECYGEILDIIFYTGENKGFLQKILNEALILAAIQNNRILMKHFKQIGIVFGLFEKPFINNRNVNHSISNKASRTQGFVIEDFEVQHWASEFYKIFPKERFFIPEKELPPSVNNPMDYHYIEGEMPQEADIKKPNKIIDLQGKKIPQLVWFAMNYKVKEVEKLLEVEVNVDKLSSSGESALFIAIRNMDKTLQGPEGDIRMFKMLSELSHKRETLEVLTSKKHLSVLGASVETGNPEIVKKVLEMMKEVKANVDIKYCGEKNKFHITPLYQAVQLFVRQPKYKVQDNKNVEFMRRTNSIVAGITTEQTLQKYEQISNNPYIKQIMELKSDICREEYLKQYKTDNLINIIELLLEAGSNPNEPHSSSDGILRGYTPLMLAAEMDLVEVFDLLVKAKGNVNKECEYIDSITGELKNTDCWRIALGYKSRKILQYLEKNCKGDGKLIIL